MTFVRWLLDRVLDGYDPALAHYRDRMAHRYVFREFDQAKSTAAVARLRVLDQPGRLTRSAHERAGSLNTSRQQSKEHDA